MRSGSRHGRAERSRRALAAAALRFGTEPVDEERQPTRSSGTLVERELFFADGAGDGGAGKLGARDVREHLLGAGAVAVDRHALAAELPRTYCANLTFCHDGATSLLKNWIMLVVQNQFQI